VPLIVAGQAVAEAAKGRESQVLVQATDLFPTILEIAGVTPPARRDAVSFASQLVDPSAPGSRTVAFSQFFLPNGGPIDPPSHERAARGERYKLIRKGTETKELYDLLLDPYEQSPLDLEDLTIEQLSAYHDLDRAIAVRTSVSPVPAAGRCALGVAALLIIGFAGRRLPHRPRPGADYPSDVPSP
jgi:arylsulfatase A-like enzyme